MQWKADIACVLVMTTYPAIEDEINAAASEVISSVGCYGSVKCTQDVIVAVYLADGYI